MAILEREINDQAITRHKIAILLNQLVDARNVDAGGQVHEEAKRELEKILSEEPGALEALLNQLNQ